MITEDQGDVIAFLETASTHGGAAVERIDTHASIVFLAGDRAWKLKRAVRYEFLDFSTAERRRAMCEAELRINQRTTPSLYRGVRPITRDARGALSIGGPGAPVDWVIEMIRFDQHSLFDRLAERDALPVDWMAQLARTIADAHATAEHCDRGGVSGIRWVIDGNEQAFGEPFAKILDSRVTAGLTAAARAEVERQRSRLDRRRADGFVRRCHGDLHLRNIVLLDGRPQLFDAIEFNDAISCIDVLYDLAFLLMDLWRRQLTHHANRLWNRYVAETGDLDGAPLLPLFLSCRAAVRAKTESIEAELQQDRSRRRELEDAARQYLDMALQLLRHEEPRIVAIGGISGSGKSTVALSLAPQLGAVPGALVFRSDELRKRLSGVDPLTRLGPDAYSQETSGRVYAELIQRAVEAARIGQVVIADAVFAREADRVAIEQAAAKAGVPFAGVWLDVPDATLIDRVTARRGDASDATAEVVRAQLEEDLGTVTWNRIDGSAEPLEVLRRVSHMLQKAGADLGHSP